MADVETVVDGEVVDLELSTDVDPRALDILFTIQQGLKVPKGERNTYSNYNYRNIETILQTAKQHAAPYRSAILCTDDLEFIGQRYYVKATCSLITPYGTISATARAQEAEPRGGMDPGQLTGSCSSYARKYAAQGLFAISGEDDLDTLPPAVTYPEGQFDAKCGYCGRIGHNLNARTVQNFKCPNCGHIDWIPE